MTETDGVLPQFMYERIRDGLLPMSSQKHLSGYKQGSGICCECCNTVVSPSQFEAHAGCASRRKPYDQTFTTDGMSLHEISVKMSTELGISGEQRDEISSVCKNVGREMSSSKEKVTNKREHLFAIESQLEIGESLSRLRTRKRVVESYADKEDHDEDKRRTTGSRSKKAKVVNDGVPKKLKELLQTGLLEGLDFWYLRGLKCEKEYHVACLKKHDMDDLKAIPKEDWLCSHGCKSVNNALNDLVKRCEQNLPTNLEGVIPNNLDIKWRVLHANNKSDLVKMHRLFAEDVSVFHENFDPIMYEGTEQDIIPHLVYSRKLREKEFRGMHCAVLHVNSTIVCAAVFCVLSKQVAEIPLVSTKMDFVGKGYFRCLYLCIETWLKNHGIQNLFVPAATSTRSM